MDRRLLRLGRIDSGYTTVGWALATMGVGMGFTMAPATESIMGSLPVAKAGVGSAMNDTTRDRQHHVLGLFHGYRTGARASSGTG